ncbi:ABC transporter ATP-binding protein [Lysinibacillus sp. 2017]|uniref:ABC transporter ATP-binding protein n=1 Tax=unclassified Lysinibacillus TaxID=2636778 RepID=UPI000D52A36D|nr:MULTISPECIES: ABC transporter ATP-binding protein [unclassified Lysinibacillus]AWE07652.1 ABC transporter ATP-binding protein [Lysinibacillus sp. 2017]TGN36814.1 ABC transporter ATP-binding protein [Lysinibacillus sp. S2017]
MTAVITIDSLTKQYGDKRILSGISFTIEQGEIFALIGTNGAGKTTALECIEGLRNYGGTIKLNGNIGVQLQSTSLPKNIKTIEAIKLFAKWNGSTIDKGLIQRLNIEAMMNKKYKELSTGQKRRLHLVLAMIGDPEIIFLDEPTAGLDVEGRVALHEEIRTLKKRGKTIVMTSHDMAEVEELCDRLAILKKGKIGFIGTVYEFTEKKNDTYIMHLKLATTINTSSLSACTYVGEHQGYHLFETNKLEDGLYELTSIVRAEENSIDDLKIEQTSLEQRFMDLAKEELV